jgi:hypothetical protein
MKATECVGDVVQYLNPDLSKLGISEIFSTKAMPEDCSAGAGPTATSMHVVGLL